MRGGTSNAIVFHRRDLPADVAEWPRVFLAAMGSPDPNGRQLNGMGGGISSLSKICVVGPPSRLDADIDYSFFQIGVKDNTVDISGNCGNMSSAMGPFALDEGLVPAPESGTATVRIHNTNTKKIILSHFPVKDGRAAVEGDFDLPGVAGTSAPIRLEFLDPGGAGTGQLLPTGNARDSLQVPELGIVDVSMVDAANPCVFVDAGALGRRGDELPGDLDIDTDCLRWLESIRLAASVAMSIAPNKTAAAAIPSIPKVAMLAAPRDTVTLSGAKLGAEDFDILVRMISVGQPHRAVPLTGALCLGVAMRVPGSVAHALASKTAGPARIANPSGLLVVDADVGEENGQIVARHGAVYRSARRLFEGNVLIPKGAVS